MREDSGFSLVELIITIAIVAILTLVAVPNLMSWVPKNRVKDAAQDLYGNIQMAKMEAIKRNRSCTVSFSGGPEQYFIGLINKSVKMADYGSGVKIDKIQTAPAPPASPVTVSLPETITFNSRGFGDKARDVFLTNEANSATYRITILVSGVVTINLM